MILHFFKRNAKAITTIIMLLSAMPTNSQTIVDSSKAQASKADAEIEKKASEWTAALQLNDEVKSQKIHDAILTHLKAVRDWHNEHPSSLVPAGINPATGNKLSELDRQVIICSTKPISIHQNLMNQLKAQLDSTQLSLILDKYTVGKVAFTLGGYKSIVTDLTATEEAEILKNLRQAREQAIDYKSMKEISAIFEIYKTKCEQYLNNNGRNWRQLYKSYSDKIKAQKQKA